MALYHRFELQLRRRCQNGMSRKCTRRNTMGNTSRQRTITPQMPEATASNTADGCPETLYTEIGNLSSVVISKILEALVFDAFSTASASDDRYVGSSPARSFARTSYSFARSELLAAVTGSYAGSVTRSRARGKDSFCP